jgi:hypothetical protein
VSNGKQKDEHDLRREELPFIRSFVRLLVRSFVCRRGVIQNDNVRQKSDDEGKKEQKQRWGKKKSSCSSRTGVSIFTWRATEGCSSFYPTTSPLC